MEHKPYVGDVQLHYFFSWIMNEYIRATYMNKYHEVDKITRLFMREEAPTSDIVITSYKLLIQDVELALVIQEK